MLNCIIIDDEEHACQLLKTHVEKVPFLKLNGVFTDAIQALAFLQQEGTDLIFLDIQMPELNGIQVLEIINGKYKVIITSAYTEYALLGYEHDVVDYLSNPFPWNDSTKPRIKPWIFISVLYLKFRQMNLILKTISCLSRVRQREKCLG